MKVDKQKIIRETLNRLLFSGEENNLYLADLEYLLTEKPENEESYMFVMCFMRAHKDEIFQYINKSDLTFEKFKTLILGYIDNNPRYKKLTDNFMADFSILNKPKPQKNDEPAITEKKEIKNNGLFYFKSGNNNNTISDLKPAKIEALEVKLSQKVDEKTLKVDGVENKPPNLRNDNVLDIPLDNAVLNNKSILGSLVSLVSMGSIVVEAAQPKKEFANKPLIDKIFKNTNKQNKPQDVGNYIINPLDVKTREETQRNIDSLIPPDGDLVKFYKENLSNMDIFGKFGFFSDGKMIAQLNTEYRLKFMSLYIKLFPLFTHDQKAQMGKKIEQHIFHNFFDTDSLIRIRTSLLFIRKSPRPQFPKDTVSTIINKSIRGVEYTQLGEFTKCNTEEDVRELYLLHILNKAYKIFPEIYEKKIVFYLYIMLMKNPIFLSQDDLLNDLFIVKNFYCDTAFSLFEIRKKQIVYKGISFSKMNYELTFNDLFTEAENTLARSVLNTIDRFYDIEHMYLDLISDNNYKFSMEIVELVYRKSKAKGNIVPSLIKLEEQLYNNYLNLNEGFKSNFGTLSYKDLYKNQYQFYRRINDYCKIIGEKIKATVKLYPYGSITQFLGSKTSDLDLYVEITGLNNVIDNTLSLTFFHTFEKNIHKLKSISDVQFVMTARLVTLSFTYSGCKVDLNYYGIPGVLNSTLLRCYAVCDPRFMILAYNLKDYLKQKGHSNTTTKKVFLNSFSWMMILVTFLQDIVTPPVLPKILRECDFKDVKLEKNKRKPKTYGYKSKYDMNDLYETDMDMYLLNDNFFTRYMDIYKKQIKVRNEMSCAELYTKFIEFMAFFFKHDSVYIDTTVERFLNKSENKRFNDNGKFNFGHFNDAGQKNCFVLRDPFDHTYNPARIAEEHRGKLFEGLRDYYFQLIGAPN
jgi:hypothetical protein